MKIVVGGSRRGVGKTEFVCALLRSARTERLSAIKITDEAHGMDSVAAEWHWRDDGDGVAQSEDRPTATARYRAAGAAEAWLMAADGDLEETFSKLPENAIVESTRGFAVAPREAICVLLVSAEDRGDAGAGSKPHLAQALARADAVWSEVELEADGGVALSLSPRTQRFAGPVGWSGLTAWALERAGWS